jgi:AraC-like DNA-binding protein
MQAHARIGSGLKAAALHPEPASPLHPYVSSIWTYRSAFPDQLEIVLPTASPQLLINLHEDRLSHLDQAGCERTRASGAAVQGVLTRKIHIDTAQKRDIVGVQFRAAGLAAFVNGPVSRFTDTLVDAASIWGAAGARMRRTLIGVTAEQRLEVLHAFLIGQVNPEFEGEALVSAALTMLADGATVESTKDRLGLSQRAIHKLFDHHVGVRPKLFVRISRVADAIQDHLRTANWSARAVDLGFSDQSHLVREFGHFVGSPPTGYSPSEPGEPFHAPVLAASTERK